MKKSSRKGFSMMGGLISFLMVSLALAATIPIMTKMSEMQTNVDRNALECIKNQAADITISDVNGDSTAPVQQGACYKAIKAAQFNTGNAIKSLRWKAGHGTPEDKIATKKILRTACDLGGDLACDYFIFSCMKEGDTSCSDPASFLDLRYYISLRPNTVNQGSLFVKERMEKVLPHMSENLINEMRAACAATSNSIACELDEPWLYIKGCSLGYEEACEEAHDNNYNKSCSQIKANWRKAPSDTYKLTYNGAASPETAYCNMYNTASAAITGCNAVASGGDNCTAASGENYDC
ncbi:MAG TPA: hypothetical protein P5556_09945, partial [Candidatus Gastranaerophilales bacterium]|nr:hypothetical protein [Candidatus Gastranaerophilales bacterium]